MPTVPVQYAVGDTQGAIGFMFQNALGNALMRRGIRIPVVQLLDDQSVRTLAQALKDRLSQARSADEEPSADGVADESDPLPAADNAASSRWIGMLSQLNEVSDDDLDDMLQEVLVARKRRDDD